MEHTKGKWEIDVDSREGGADQIVCDGFTICFMATGDEGEAEANAHLIAAAPETKKQRDALLEALEEIRDLETKACSRCEGNGRLYADGKAHLISENAATILCGNCGGSGRILPEDAQDIAEAAIAKAKEE